MIYCYKGKQGKGREAAWSIFVNLITICEAGYLQEVHMDSSVHVKVTQRQRAEHSLKDCIQS